MVITQTKGADMSLRITDPIPFSNLESAIASSRATTRFLERYANEQSARLTDLERGLAELEARLAGVERAQVDRVMELEAENARLNASVAFVEAERDRLRARLVTFGDLR